MMLKAWPIGSKWTLPSHFSAIPLFRGTSRQNVSSFLMAKKTLQRSLKVLLESRRFCVFPAYFSLYGKGITTKNQKKINYDKDLVKGFGERPNVPQGCIKVKLNRYGKR